MVAMMPPLAFPKVHVVFTGATVHRPIKKQKALSSALAAQALQIVSTVMPFVNSADADHYSNTLRERDRYQIQWFDYACKNCGVVWKADCVTISFRQTAVSQCLKGPEEVQRPPRARAHAGGRALHHDQAHGR
eukprot:2241379-Prymnesium_polylepis.2